ncbi:hypothetical protein GOBAR_DD26416 [Gossypium barbadense]|nr:hypothetical protein GOBAR_DD26416 [Gossypium barbadense]
MPIQSPPPGSLPSKPHFVSCSAVTLSPTQTSYLPPRKLFDPRCRIFVPSRALSIESSVSFTTLLFSLLSRFIPRLIRTGYGLYSPSLLDARWTPKGNIRFLAGQCFRDYKGASVLGWVSLKGIQQRETYAEAQARYLSPDKLKVKELVHVLKEKQIGVVAHFYMDPEVQGILTAAQKEWPHIHISDSLVMADSAVKMVKSGCKFITVLGVDFMSENVRAILDQAGFGEVGVYRMSNERIGCSLADAAATPDYMNYLESASNSLPSLHVVYINTSLETKAYSHELVPTITCTSSNVVPTILQAFAQVPDLNIWYGPDSYMGANIKELFQQMTLMSDEEIAEIHPKHNRDSIKSLLPRLHYYENGTCIVHHLFGHEVVERINEMYCDAFLTAHFEVPGEMFSLAMEAKRRGMGVVGSTQNILDFIKQRVQEALDRNVDDHLQFVLGTESGMVTSIVAAVRSLLDSSNSTSSTKINVEIVFPVSSDSMTKTSTSASPALISVKAGDDVILPVVPGVASGEGCSIHGGCASCPYMKMNSLSSLLNVCHHLPDERNNLKAYETERFKSQTPQGKSIADVGCQPILHMRHFQAKKELSEELVYQVLGSHGILNPPEVHNKVLTYNFSDRFFTSLAEVA